MLNAENTFDWKTHLDDHEKAKRAFYSESLSKEEKEDTISLDSYYSTEYARIIGVPFHKGEASIAKDAKLSTLYAVDVIHGRFILGEKIISKNSRFSCVYSLLVMKGKKNDLIHRSMMEMGIRQPNDYWVRQYFRYMEHVAGKCEPPFWVLSHRLDWFA